MGYRCPVCSETVADGEHLAHHLAVMAALGRPDHETWLAETVPEWADLGPSTLAERVTPHAATVDASPDDRPAPPPDDGGEPFEPPSDGTVEEVLETARELTRRRRED